MASKKSTLIFVLCILTSIGYGQDILGDWYGKLEIPGVSLRIVFHLQQEGDVYTATMDSPDQNAMGIPVKKVAVDGANLRLEIPEIQFVYEGTANGRFKKIKGTATQMGNSVALDLKRTPAKKPLLKRPQEPKAPFPYYTEEVRYFNQAAGIHLGGTLTLPRKRGKHPIAILISGSGPQNRDSEIFGHKPFLVIADYLTRKGIGVLRFDERGIGESEGRFGTATSADFATDVQAAISYLRTRSDVKKRHIGLIGHSEGGMIAPMVAANNKQVDFIVLLAGPGMPVVDMMELQIRAINESMGIDAATAEENVKLSKEAYVIALTAAEDEDIKPVLRKHFQAYIDQKTDAERQAIGNTETFVNSQVATIDRPWFRYFIKHDPTYILPDVQCPILALNGELDVQVLCKENLASIENILETAKHKDYTTKAFPKVNHLFQNCKTGATDEYQKIEQTFAPEVLDLMTTWIKKRV